MQATAPDPQLTFDVGNPGAPHTIFITRDPAVNRVTLTIATTADVSLAAGRPVPPRSASRAVGSLIYVDLSELELSDAEFAALELRNDAWAFDRYADVRKLCLAPVERIELRAGGSVSIAIDRLTLADPPSGASAQLVATYYRVPPATDGNVGVVSDFQVLLQEAPHAGRNLHPAIKAQVSQPWVIASTDLFPGVVNDLRVVLAPGDRPRSARAGSETSFSLTFVYADGWPGYGALCTRREARAIRVTAGAGAGDWEITRGGGQSPAWLLKPPAGEILGNPDTGTVELKLDGLVSSLAGGPTLALLSYSGIEGYKDGSYALLLQKLPHVGISALEVTPNPVVLRDGVADVVVSWRVEHAGALSLAPLHEPVTGRTSVRATIRDTTPFTLTAEGPERATSGNRAIRNVTAVVLPVINTFTASPAPIWDGDFPRRVKLAWNVNTGGTLRLLSSRREQPIATGLPAVGQHEVTIDEPQMFTLVPEDAAASPLVRRSLVVSAFRPTFATASLDAAASAVAIAPNAAYVVVADAAGSVTPLDTIVYKPLTDPLPTGAGPVAIDFSPDGRELFVANSGAGTVSVFDVTPTDEWPSFAFTLRQTVDVGGAPRGVALSPDGAWLYVTIDNCSARGALSYARRAADGTIGSPSSIALGRAPRGIAVAASGAQLYAANSADDSVSVIGRSSGGRHQLVKTIRGLRSEPVDVALSVDDDVLLVACSGTATVVAIDAEFPDSAPSKALEVGARPRALALVPGGAYALVACAGGGVSLLNVGRRPSGCSVLESAIAAGEQPSSVAVSRHAGLALVGQQNAKLGLLTLAEYAQQESPTAVGDGVTDVVVTPDGAQALTWHDALIELADHRQSTGYTVYELASHTTTEQEAGTPLVDIAPVQRIAAESAYSVALRATAVQVLSTRNHQSRFEIDLPGDVGGPVGLSSSHDGALLLVLASKRNEHTLVPYAVDLGRADARSLGAVPAFTASGSTEAFVVAAPDGGTAYAINSTDGQLWVARRGRAGGFAFGASPVPIPEGIADAVVSPDGSRLYLLSQSGLNNSISVYETAAGRVRTVLLPSVQYVALNGLAVSPDGTRLFAADGLRAGIRVFDAASLRLVQTISWTSQVRVPWGVAALPDGSQVFTANAGSGNLATAQQVQPGVRQPA